MHTFLSSPETGEELLTPVYLLQRTIIGVVFLSLVSLIWPLWDVLAGFVLGFLFLMSLIVTKRIKMIATLQMMLFFAFSLIRVVLFGYAFIWITHGDPSRILLVLAGFLGYSSWVFLERLLPALGFRLSLHKAGKRETKK